jgi:hypothetical protein
MLRPVVLASSLVLAAASPGTAQALFPLTLPLPSQAATVTQRIGLTDISVTYHRPAVGGRKVWGGIVPYGQVWRAGANENTVLTLGTDATVGGVRVPAGSYGVHMIPTPSTWTLILSREHQAWGSFFYDQKDDAARFTVTPVASPFVERLAYTFDDPGEASVVATLRWEGLAVPIRIEVDTPEVVLTSLRSQLRGAAGFNWRAFAQAATWCANHEVGLDQAQVWADRAVTMNRSYVSLRAQALVTEARGDRTAAATLREQALELATEPDLNAYGYELLQAGKAADAIGVFRRNLAQHPESWNAHDSLGEGLAASGDNAGAIAEYRKARAMVKDETNQKRIDAVLAGLGAAK